MTARSKTRPIEKEKYRIFLRRAEELLRTMRRASEAGDTIAAGVNGVQCAIALVDAVTVAYLGSVSTGQSHDEAATLLTNPAPKGPMNARISSGASSSSSTFSSTTTDLPPARRWQT